jgi:hypothetical protein
MGDLQADSVRTLQPCPRLRANEWTVAPTLCIYLPPLYVQPSVHLRSMPRLYFGWIVVECPVLGGYKFKKVQFGV